jgi:hypothetical protein
MIPDRRDGMLTEIPLAIQIIKSVYMILYLSRLDGISATDAGIPPKRDEKFPYKHFSPPSRAEK